MTEFAIPVAREKDDLRRRVSSWRSSGQSVALVPTMGALHDGHVALVLEARANCDRTVVSIFVNPTQFAPNEDFEKYPRSMETDCALLADLGCDLAWAPTVPTMYPDGFATKLSVGGPGDDLESRFRPHFFNGVAIVCCKLFQQVAPDVAIFGEKDYQQLLVVRRMVTDLDLPLQIIGCPTVREPDGLALSSRNAYLTGEERAVAPSLFRRLSELRHQIAQGAAIAEGEKTAAAQLIEDGFSSVDYVAVRHAETLAPLTNGDLTGTNAAPGRILAAARLGRTRLIDNIPLVFASH